MLQHVHYKMSQNYGTLDQKSKDANKTFLFNLGTADI